MLDSKISCADLIDKSETLLLEILKLKSKDWASSPTGIDLSRLPPNKITPFFSVGFGNLKS
jgi:hypothetical protein